VGCSTSSSTEEKKVFEECYDGVVYISEANDGRTLSVKFESDGNVATETFDGFKCKNN
jgi:hypothetical protein